jgi:hypothetical protein
MKPGELVAVPSSTFANEKILERSDLQRLLRARIDAIADDVRYQRSSNDETPSPTQAQL